jgi:hypothetical protein
MSQKNLKHSEWKEVTIWKQSQFQDVLSACMFTSASEYNLRTYTDQLLKTKLDSNSAVQFADNQVQKIWLWWYDHAYYLFICYFCLYITE